MSKQTNAKAKSPSQIKTGKSKVQGGFLFE